MLLDYCLIDAFTKTPYAGNPCTVVFDADTLNEYQMQKIAREMNQSETAFLMSSKTADWRARYFTVDREIPLAGHPTIASSFALRETNRISSLRSEFSIELQVGKIRLEIDIDSKSSSPLISMYQPSPEFRGSLDKELAAKIYALPANDILGAEIVSTGTAFALIQVKCKEQLDELEFDSDLAQKVMNENNFFGFHIFYYDSQENQTYARHLCPPPDLSEDPFTGSASGCMAAYLWKHQICKQSQFTAFQGQHMKRPGQAQLSCIGSFDQIQAVKLSGTAVLVASGQVRID